MKLDLHNNSAALLLISPQTIASATTTNGTGVDISSYEGVGKATLMLGSVTGTSVTIDVNIQESDTVGGTYTTVTSFTQRTDASDNIIDEISVDLRSRKAFIRGQVVTAGTTPSVPISLAIHLPRTASLPV